MNIKGIGQQIKAGALFTVGAQLAQKGISVAKEKYGEYKEGRAIQKKADAESSEMDEKKSKLEE